MQVFHDVDGRDWTLDLNIASAKPLSAWCERQDPPVNLFDASQFLTMASSIIKAVDALAILTTEQRDARGVTCEDFGRALKGGTAYDAQRALLREYADFFPDPGVGSAIGKSLTRLEESSKREQRLIEKALEATINAYTHRVDAVEKALASGSSTSESSPDSADSEQTISG